MATRGDIDTVRRDIEAAKSELKLWTTGLAGVVIAAMSAIKFFGH